MSGSWAARRRKVHAEMPEMKAFTGLPPASPTASPSMSTQCEEHGTLADRRLGPSLCGLDYPRAFVSQLVARIAGATPQAVALQAGRSCLTYRELDAHAGRLAAHLRLAGAGRDVAVGVCLER